LPRGLMLGSGHLPIQMEVMRSANCTFSGNIHII
jgi:hypothetical protein